MTKPNLPLPLEARRSLWARMWDRLLQPLPSEVLGAETDDRADPPDLVDAARAKELPR